MEPKRTSGTGIPAPLAPAAVERSTHRASAPSDTAWPMRRAAPPRGLEMATESLLAAPLPGPPGSPRLRVGRDYLPLPGDPEFDPTLEPRRSTVLWLRTRRRNLQGVLAVLLGFGAGLAIAWLVGLF